MLARLLTRSLVVVCALGLLASSVMAAPGPLAAKVAPRLADLPAGDGWLAAPMHGFNPQHPPTLFCQERSPGLNGLAASQVVLRDFITPTLDILRTTTVAFRNVAAAHHWYALERRDGFGTCAIQGLESDQAVWDPLQGVHGTLTLVRSATPRLDVGTEAFELTATFAQSADRWMHVWALAHYGRIVFVIQGSWFADGSPINPAPVLAKLIKRTPPR